MRILFFIIFHIFLLNALTGQSAFKSVDEKSIAVGYIYNSWENTTKDFHLLELEYWHTRYSTGIHYFAFSKYVGTEIGINTEKFTVGPKIGVTINYSPFIFGVELVTYTDFNEATLRLAPVIGYGNHQVRLSFCPQIRLLNRSFFPTHQGQFNLAIRIIKLKEEVYQK